MSPSDLVSCPVIQMTTFFKSLSTEHKFRFIPLRRAVQLKNWYMKADAQKQAWLTWRKAQVEILWPQKKPCFAKPTMRQSPVTDNAVEELTYYMQGLHLVSTASKQFIKYAVKKVLSEDSTMTYIPVKRPASLPCGAGSIALKVGKRQGMVLSDTLDYEHSVSETTYLAFKITMS